MTPTDLHPRFAALLADYGNIAELSRQSGLHRRTLEKKRDGELRVLPWDIWALERTIQLKRDGAT